MKKSSTYEKWKITPIQADFGVTLLLDKNSDPVQKDCLLVCAKSIKKSYPDLPIAVITDQSINMKEVDYVIPQEIAIDSYWTDKKINLCTLYWLTPFKVTLFLDNDFIVTDNQNFNQYYIESINTITFPQNVLSFREHKLSYNHRVLEENNIQTLLPHTFAFKRDDETTLEFFNLWYQVCQDWQAFFPYVNKTIKFKNFDSTIALSLTAHILGITKEIKSDVYTYVHMNPFLERTFPGIRNPNWSSFLKIWPSDDGIAIENYKVNKLLHYKDKKVISIYKKQINEWLR